MKLIFAVLYVSRTMGLTRYIMSVFTALHVMQTRYSEENSVCLSVRLSVRPSVCLSHA